MGCGTPGLPVHHYLPEFAQTHVRWFDDAIQPSHPLSFPSPPTFNLSQHQGFFPKSQIFVSGAHSIGASASTSVILMNIQGLFPLGFTGLICLLSKRLSRVFFNITFESINSLALSLFYCPTHICTWLLEIYGALLAKWCLYFLLCCQCFSLKEQAAFILA